MFEWNDDLFPTEVEWSISEDSWSKPEWNLRQVRIDIDGETFAVINCSQKDGKWEPARFIILRATVPERELNQMIDVVTKAQKIIPLLSIETTTMDDIKKLF